MPNGRQERTAQIEPRHEYSSSDSGDRRSLWDVRALTDCSAADSGIMPHCTWLDSLLAMCSAWVHMLSVHTVRVRGWRQEP